LDETNEWSKDLSFFFPNTGTEKENVANYIQLHYFRQEYNPNSPNTVLKSPSYWDTAFGGIHIPESRLSSPLRHYVNSKKTFLHGSNFAYVAENGFYNDQNLILFYAKNSSSFIQSEKALLI
jgi:hypothetical protein